MKVQIVTLFRVSRLQFYGVTERSVVRGVYVPPYRRRVDDVLHIPK
jgi:hypothetical protein